MSLVKYLSQTDTIQTIVKQATGAATQLLLGVNGTVKAASIAAIFNANPRQILVIADTQTHAEQLYFDVAALVDDVYQFPAEESVATEMAISSSELRLQRLQTLMALVTGQPMIVVTNLAGAERLLPDMATVTAARW